MTSRSEQQTLTETGAAAIDFPEPLVEDLRMRLCDTRRPAFEYQDGWAFGMPPETVGEIAAAWSAQLESAWELPGRLEKFAPTRVVMQSGHEVRVFHIRSTVRGAMPIVLTHGWPSTVLENLRLAERLASPTANGARGADAFHVVVPALPGFPLGSAPADLAEYTGAAIADRWAQTMVALGYERFAASGGDVGARVSAWLGARHAEQVIGIHVTGNALRIVHDDADQSPAEREWIASRARWSHFEGGYMHIQQTKPLTLAYGLAQSPIALAAWIGEKWAAWTGVENPLETFSSELLDHLSLYWLTNRIGTSFLPYYVYDRAPGARPWGKSVKVPVSFYLCPNEIGGVPPRSFAERQYDVNRWVEFPRGGHFTAAEQPDALARDIRDAFRSLR